MSVTDFFREFWRWVGLITGWPVQLLLFKRKTYYEDKSVQGRRIRGGALIVSNHFSLWDYVVNMFLFFGRKLHVVMIDRMYKKSRYFHIGMDCLGGIPANRDDKGMRFVGDSVAVLEKGGLVQIYPEAYISRDGEMHSFKHAYLMIALMADVPIIPVILDGNYGLFKRTHVIIGKPIKLSDYNQNPNPSREEIAALNSVVENKCRELKDMLDRSKVIGHNL